MKPTLVTGAAGFAGSHLIDRLAVREQAAPIVAWHRPGGAPPRHVEGVTWQAVDLLDKDAVVDALARIQPAAVYHCAGATHVGRAWNAIEATLAVNVRGTHHLIEGLRTVARQAKVLIPSSAMVYAPADMMLGEDHPLRPSNPYGLSKLAQELVGTGNLEGPQVYLARPFNHFGPRQDAWFVSAGFARRIAAVEAGRCQPEIQVGNLDAARDLTDVRDTVRAYTLILEHGSTQRPYNVCSGRAVSIQRLLDLLLARARVPIRVVVDPARYRPNDQPVVVGNPARIHAELGWSPEISLAQTLDDLLEYLADQRVTTPGVMRSTPAEPAPPSSAVSLAQLLLAACACVVFTIFITWPQAGHLSTHVASHGDAYFSMWRLEWLAHALRTAPGALFDGNIFYPTRNTLAYSDAMLLEGAIAAPLLWSGVSPFIVYNLLLIGGIAASGIGMFVLVRRLTGSSAGAILAAAVFTMAPYRIEHFMHLELQWAMWMPLTFWAIHRTIETTSWRNGALTAMFLWLQIISCVYYGVFLAIAAAALVGLLLAVDPRRTVRALPVLIAGSAAAAVLAAPYLWPYIKAIRTVGGRAPDEIARYSAHLTSYLASPAQNWIWGWTRERWGDVELNLFPGLTACVLAALGLAVRPRRNAVVYGLLSALMIALSLGVNGTLYLWLATFVPGLNGLRAPARFGILACASIAVMAGFGARALEQRIGSRRWAAGILVLAGMLMAVEYANHEMQLMPQGDPAVTPLYRVVRAAPPGVVVELPLPSPSTLPGREADYMFWSTAHWKPLVNGYSGYAPVEYVRTLERMSNFPDDRSIATLRGLDVRYVIVHKAYYEPADYTALMLRVATQPKLRPYGKFLGPGGDGDLFILEPQ